MKNTNMPIRTRFAPSPTGRLHLGHVMAARVARDLAHSEAGGAFLLRYEDIDTSRVRDEFYAGIDEDLKWLGLTWDETPIRQTERGKAYEEAFEELKNRELIYPCFCTRKDIQAEWAAIGGAPHGDEVVYPAICTRLSNQEQQERLDLGHPHAWRLDSEKAAAEIGPTQFHDMRFGTIDVDPSQLGDVVIARKDIGISYHLAVVVDDAFQQITHVTRGEDLLKSTHVHRILQELLDLPEPTYLHHELVLDEKGVRLAKRSDSLAIATLRERGRAPDEVLQMTRI